MQKVKRRKFLKTFTALALSVLALFSASGIAGKPISTANAEEQSYRYWDDFVNRGAGGAYVQSDTLDYEIRDVHGWGAGITYVGYEVNTAWEYNGITVSIPHYTELHEGDRFGISLVHSPVDYGPEKESLSIVFLYKFGNLSIFLSNSHETSDDHLIGYAYRLVAGFTTQTKYIGGTIDGNDYTAITLKDNGITSDADTDSFTFKLYYGYDETKIAFSADGTSRFTEYEKDVDYGKEFFVPSSSVRNALYGQYRNSMFWQYWNCSEADITGLRIKTFRYYDSITANTIREKNDKITALESNISDMQRTISSLNAQIDTLNAQLDAITAEKEENEQGYQNEIDTLNNRIASLESDIAQKDAQIENLESTVASLNRVIENDTAQAQELQSRISELETALNNADTEYETLETEYETLEEYKAALEAELAEKQQEAEDLNATIARLNETVDSLSYTKTVLEGEKADLQNNLNTVTAEKEELTAELNSKTSEYETALAGQQEEIDTLNASIDTLNERISGYQTEITTLNAQIAELEETNETLRDFYERKILELSTQIDDKNRSINTLNSIIDSLRDKENQLNSQIDALSTMIWAMEQDMAADRELIRELRAQKNAFERQLEVVSSENVGYIAQLKNESLELEKLNNELAELKGSNTQAEKSFWQNVSEWISNNVLYTVLIGVGVVLIIATPIVITVIKKKKRG